MTKVKKIKFYKLLTVCALITTLLVVFSVSVFGGLIDKNVELNINVGQSSTINLQVQTGEQILWESLDSSIAKVTNSGKVQGLKAGTTVVVAYKKDSTIVGQATVNVTNYVEKLLLKNDTISVSTGKSQNIDYTLIDYKASDLKWESSNSAIVSVDANGKITTHQSGTATVYCSTSDGLYKDSCVVKSVFNSKDFSMSKTLLNMELKDTFKLSLLNASNLTSKVVWSSSNSEIASVSSTGTVTANSYGEATITATVEGATYSCSVVIMGKISLAKTTGTISLGQTIMLKATTGVKSSSVTWTSSNNKVATVVNGFIESVGVGECVITASVSSGKTYAKAQFTVKVSQEQSVFSAYAGPNIASSGSDITITVVTPTSQSDVNIRVKDINGIISNLEVKDKSYTDKTVNGRTVRVWKMITNGLTLPSNNDYYKYTLYAFGNSTTGSSYTFNSYISSVANTSEPVVGYRMVSDKLLEFRKTYEGYCPTVMYDVVNIPTIGYGNALIDGEVFYNNQTQEEAIADMIKFFNSTLSFELNKFVNVYDIALTQCQFDALASFSYNYGQYSFRYYDFYLRDLLVEHKNGDLIDPQQLHYAFGRLSYAGGYFYEGLFRARIDEWEMFTKNDYKVTPYNSSSMVGDFAIPSKADREDPEKYKGYFKWAGDRY